ncbi:GerAB/ArcD/ProY family transporter [Lysinibacillus endophyticus]|uniref:GerAB/ArcD/ProY family transporter n=1 Tax=Ureibacillus endophyticus TaxID=1978490 RepID=UPI00209E022E|nr:GerAB/ArcD/ProY family transporter [Lysinibacillus endophyticus]MCP1144438.1 GerAB/ArcD/ProY family transporter [Lysinibacillus endophyticus]
MSRYFYYFVLINMVANIIASVPSILLRHYNEGSVSAMVLATITGTLIITVYAKFFIQFPGMTLPDLLKKTTAKWFYVPLILIMTVVWFIAGMITLITFTFLLIRYLTPEMPIILISLSIILSVILGCLIKTDRVLYTVEIIMLITFPLIIYIFFKASTDANINWNFIKEATLYINQMPNLESFTSSFYLFLGVGNLFIFNRFFNIKQKFGWKQIISIFFITILTLFTTYFIPIGFHGTSEIESLVYPWLQTSDSLRMKYSLIERVLFVFLLFYLCIAFLSILIHWHVAVEYLKYLFTFEKIKVKDVNIGILIPPAIFTVISTYFVQALNESQLFRFSSIFYMILAGFFPCMILVFFYIKRRMKYAENTK